MKSNQYKNRKVAGWIWLTLAVMTIIFSGPTRRYLEMKWTSAANAAVPQSYERKAKMSARVFQEGQYIAEIHQCISNRASVSGLVTCSFTRQSSFAFCSFVDYSGLLKKGSYPVYHSLRKLQV